MATRNFPMGASMIEEGPSTTDLPGSDRLTAKAPPEIQGGRYNGNFKGHVEPQLIVH